MSVEEKKRRLEELKDQNVVLGLAIQRSRLSVKRLKLEYGVLLERLESRIELDPELNCEDPLPTLASFKQELLTKPFRKSKIKRHKVKERDPNMPKRPTNAYLLYCEMNKERIRQNGSLDVTRDLAEGWKNLNEQDRKPYYKLYSEDRERYQMEMEIYNKKISNIDADDDKEENEQKIKNNEEGSSTKVADSKGGEDGSLVSSN
ncbi:Nhp10p [Saccharomyces cerevisiae YJM1248]|uniref:Nhp10p n=1 Tax=Saccharomyces cerevisiae (strain JAY291) TaxID=574961 RepID=C7GXZ2_YEAS2|nr:Nhp10p [Saccharomyces cerevisiae YJM195]AJU62715.1 Nhp10p [Saccharomyces cerevisiae YJM320]AJU63413.1 Nhp10p [Saccharomyces cerevisiae YJM326]AJU64817.1 Nhp10p [Saccharomyces cerevisiae YJM450]AJU65531.1 Nhp10p [Saccharomyces cerevisiae YJM451]AJU67645.1 Nhp10p [Saccharomyces cerevisiae YJM470]AJU68360.1 Nhp10p [Saccharomyces cerevisiae YJM541]AJU69052.1 Nhp10p [Saccharomyces cerevisiae YJM554]AJU70459.1 Nhp10p [Saccharomyces cerevisiae YJM627]AJU73993.1 Nhp10p [Saccharomyces cerevisiae